MQINILPYTLGKYGVTTIGGIQLDIYLVYIPLGKIANKI